jgi:hypothetical protein
VVCANKVIGGYSELVTHIIGKLRDPNSCTCTRDKVQTRR